jgi:NAD(P)-dependent dehydrogenase (short-subunit alcohol dehydrogenase family)
VTDQLAGRVAIVTGGGSPAGIGAAIARRFAAEGASVLLADILADDAERTAAEIATTGGTTVGMGVDVSDAEQVVAMVTSAVDRFGRLDILVNNAALRTPEVVAADTTVIDMDLEIWDRTIAVNLRGCLLGCKYALPHMVRAGGGSIINTSSRYGSTGDFRSTAYGVSKAGIDALTRYVATQHGKQGIRCNSIVLAAVLTGRMLASSDEAARRRVSNHLLTPEIPRPEDIADVALFLAADESRYVTGHLLAVDSGQGSHHPRYAEVIRAAEESDRGPSAAARR